MQHKGTALQTGHVHKAHRTQDQVNVLQPFSIQLKRIYATDLQGVSGIMQMAITINVLPNGYYSYKSQFVGIQWFNLRFNHEVYHTVITIRVNHRFSRGNIISVLSRVNSAISDYKEY